MLLLYPVWDLVWKFVSFIKFGDFPTVFLQTLFQPKPHLPLWDSDNMNIGSFVTVPQACRLLFFSQSIFLSFRSVLLFHPQVHWIYLLSSPILIVNLASKFFFCYSIFQFCDAHLVLFYNFYFIAGSFYFLTYFKRISNWQSSHSFKMTALKSLSRFISVLASIDSFLTQLVIFLVVGMMCDC